MKSSPFSFVYNKQTRPRFHTLAIFFTSRFGAYYAFDLGETGLYKRVSLAPIHFFAFSS